VGENAGAAPQGIQRQRLGVSQCTRAREGATPLYSILLEKSPVKLSPNQGSPDSIVNNCQRLGFSFIQHVTC